MTKRSQAIWTVIALLGTTSAMAVPVNVDITGTVGFADPVPNAFGLAVGDTITGSAFIPDADLSGAQTYTAADGLLMTFNIGTQVFTEVQDLLFPLFPSIELLNGNFVNLAFGVDNGVNLAFAATGGLWDALAYDLQVGTFELVSGTFSAVATPVINAPEPATLSLLAMGLLGVGAARRRKQQVAIARG